MALEGLERLRKFAERAPEVERCELCARALPDDHDHLLEPVGRALSCVCGPCVVLFGGSGPRKRVPRRVRRLTDLRISDAQWDALRLPIDLAYFVRSSVRNAPVAYYPSPAGATESLLSLEAWRAMSHEQPILDRMEPDVEALLVNRVGVGRGVAAAEYFLAPIDQCYRLVGLIRSHWSGLSGGTQVWSTITAFFDGLRARA